MGMWDFLKFYWGLLCYVLTKALAVALLASGLLRLIASYIEDKYPSWSPKMKTPLWKIPLWIFLALAAIRLILAPYVMYCQKQVQSAKVADIKQKIRTSIELISPEILPKIDKGQKKILVPISPNNLAKLAILSENPDFEKYLEYTQFNSGRDDDNDVYDPNIFVDVNDFRWFVVKDLYYLKPKDALIKNK
jgi:hypothetical protein